MKLRNRCAPAVSFAMLAAGTGARIKPSGALPAILGWAHTEA